MERITAEQLSEQRENLESRISRFEIILPHLPQEGFIESYLEKRGPKFANRLPNLKLANVDPITYFDRLTGPIKRVQDRIIDKTLPNLRARLVAVDEQLAETEVEPISYGYLFVPKSEPLRDYSFIRSHREMARFFNETLPQTVPLVEQFLDSQNAIDIFNAITLYYRQPKQQRDAQLFENHLAGALFAELGYLHLAPMYERRNLKLLSPYENFVLVTNAYPDRNASDDTGLGLNRSINGISTIDSYILAISADNIVLKAGVEYKCLGEVSEYRREELTAQRQRFQPNQLILDFHLNGNGKNDYPDYWGRLINTLREDIPYLPLSVDDKLNYVYAVPSNSHFRSAPIIEPVPVRTGAIKALLMALRRTISQ